MSALQELFDTDPLDLTREDRRQMIDWYRENRDKYVTRAAEPKQPKTAGEGLKLDALVLGRIGE